MWSAAPSDLQSYCIVKKYLGTNPYFPSYQYLTNIQFCNRGNHSQTIHPTEIFISMRLLQIILKRKRLFFSFKYQKFRVKIKHTVQSRVLMRVTNQKINFLSKGHSTQGLKIPFISNLKQLVCASKRDVLELAILR